MFNEIKLDGKMFEVLSSGTRRKILKELSIQPTTVSKLSRTMDIQKSAIFNHMVILIDAGLVNKKNTNNEFVYYELAESVTDYKIYVLLTSSALLIIGGFVEIYKYINNILQSISKPPEGYPLPRPPPLPQPANESFLSLMYRELSSELFIGISLIFVSLVLFYYSSKLKKNRYKF
ncbi:MAG: winged helix-turn-helix domain-containing protein [Candidatus Methanoperedens sp.]|nr:winged helix-turn-helix domain-containing protein [Candidatus Methanoperedens sp.]